MYMQARLSSLGNFKVFKCIVAKESEDQSIYDFNPPALARKTEDFSNLEMYLYFLKIPGIGTVIFKT